MTFASVLAFISAAILLPPLFAGWREAQLAQSAARSGNVKDAAAFFVSAARLQPWRRDLWEQAGINSFAAGDATGAVRQLQTGVAKGSLSARGWEALGSALWSLGEHGSAVAAWESGTQGNPQDAALLDRLATAFHQEAEYAAEQGALVRLNAVREAPAAHYRLGLLLMLLDFAHARPEIDAAARMSSDFGPAAATLEAAINAAILEQDPARRLVVLGRGLGLVDEWALAVAEFERGVQADPQSAEAWAWLGEAEQHVGQDGGPELEKAMLLDPQSGLVHALEGLYLRRKGRDSEAFAEYARAAEMEPHDPALQVLLGQANTANGDLVAALAAYQRATALAPADATYWRMLALFCDDNGVQPLEIGLPAAARAVELAPKDPQALDALGWTYAQTGYAYRAEQTLLEALRQMPLPIAHLHLGQLYLRMGESSKAQEQLNLVVQFDGSGPVGRSAAELLAHYFP